MQCHRFTRLQRQRHHGAIATLALQAEGQLRPGAARRVRHFDTLPAHVQPGAVIDIAKAIGQLIDNSAGVKRIRVIVGQVDAVGQHITHGGAVLLHILVQHQNPGSGIGARIQRDVHKHIGGAQQERPVVTTRHPRGFAPHRRLVTFQAVGAVIHIRIETARCSSRHL